MKKIEFFKHSIEDKDIERLKKAGSNETRSCKNKERQLNMVLVNELSKYQ